MSALVLRISVGLGPLGAIGSVIQFAPHFLAFALARAGWDSANPGRGAGGAGVGACRSLSCAPVRVPPCGHCVAHRRIHARLTAGKPVAATAAECDVRANVHGCSGVRHVLRRFGRSRATGPVGFERLDELREQQELLLEQRVSTQQTFLSRLSTINQLTQVVRVVEEDGFLHGETLDYLAVAFIPRALWPEKPTIAKGAWFALRIGQANLTPEADIVNSINMTIPGELYLNFGWMGVFIGLLLFGGMIAMLWSRTDFWRDSRNVLGSAYGYYLLWIWLGFSLGADLQIIVTLIAMYLVLAAVGMLTGSGEPQRAR